MMAFREYERKLQLLCWFYQEGRYEGEQYETLLCEMDILWRRLDATEQELIRKIETDLIWEP